MNALVIMGGEFHAVAVESLENSHGPMHSDAKQSKSLQTSFVLLGI